MDYSNIHIAKKVLELANVPFLNKSETEIRVLAFNCLLKKDFLAAYQVRLGKNFRSFTKGECKLIIEISGEKTIRKNIALFACCLKFGLLK